MEAARCVQSYTNPDKTIKPLLGFIHRVNNYGFSSQSNSSSRCNMETTKSLSHYYKL